MSKPAVFEADELLFEMRRTDHRVSKATIYRTLKHLLEANIITEVLIDSKHRHYQLSFGREQKSHLVCAETHKTTKITCAELNDLMERVCREHDYEPLSYRFVIHGISPEGRGGGMRERWTKSGERVGAIPHSNFTLSSRLSSVFLPEGG